MSPLLALTIFPRRCRMELASWGSAHGIRQRLLHRFGRLYVVPEGSAGFFSDYHDTGLLIMDLGVLLLTAEGGVDLANSVALKMLGCTRFEELQQHWEALQRSTPSLGQPVECGEVQLDRAGPSRTLPNALWWKRYQLGGPGGSAAKQQLILMAEGGQIEALHIDLRLATQLRTLARLARAFAHDIKGPLNAMVINLELLQDACNEHRDTVAVQAPRMRNLERQQHYFATLKSQISRLNEMLDRLVSQTGYHDEVSAVTLHDLVNEVHALLSPQAKLQHVRLRTDLTERPAVWRGHRLHLKQALLNLGVNALDATPTGGEIALSLDVEGNQGVISISDTGTGIDPSILAEVGRMYCGTKATGTGIGVYVARRIVEAHGGTLSIESLPAVGTRCRVNLYLETQEK